MWFLSGKIRKNERGFTLIELLLVIGMIMLVAAFMVPVTVSQLQRQRLDNLMKDVESNIFLYQQNAYSGKNNKYYGVAFSSDKYTLFVGDSLATAESTEIYDLESGSSITSVNLNSGGSEVVFSPSLLKPSAYGTIRFSNGLESYSLEINREGHIHYSKL